MEERCGIEKEQPEYLKINEKEWEVKNKTENVIIKLRRDYWRNWLRKSHHSIIIGKNEFGNLLAGDWGCRWHVDTSFFPLVKIFILGLLK